MENDRLTEGIIGCCFNVHAELGPGFPEKIYQHALEKALEDAHIPFASERLFRVSFQGTSIGSFKVDLLVDGCVIVEVKAVTGMLPKVFEAQVIAYLKAAEIPVGLLVNFGNVSCQIRRLMMAARASDRRNRFSKSP